jgi:hypothetical protein
MLRNALGSPHGPFHHGRDAAAVCQLGDATTFSAALPERSWIVDLSAVSH